MQGAIFSKRVSPKKRFAHCCDELPMHELYIECLVARLKHNRDYNAIGVLPQRHASRSAGPRHPPFL